MWQWMSEKYYKSENIGFFIENFQTIEFLKCVAPTVLQKKRRN